MTIDDIFSDTPGCFVIAEIAQAHDGSLGMAHAYIDAVAKTGANAIKFQTHIASAESSTLETWRVNFSYQDATRQDYWRRMEFTPEQWVGLKQHADEAGLVFLSSPFSIEAIRLLEQIGVPAWKVASGEVTNFLLMEHMANSGKPFLLSSGMSSWEELDDAVKFVRAKGLPLAVMQCTTAYPCPLEKIGLNIMDEMRSRYQCPVGLSDHSASIFPTFAAAIKGAKLIELHVTMSREMFGPDVVASLTTQELAQLVSGIRMSETMLANPMDKNGFAGDSADLRTRFGQSLVAACDLVAGVALKLEHLSCKKPAAGIPARDFRTYLGRRLKYDVAKGAFLKPDDFEPDQSFQE